MNLCSNWTHIGEIRNNITEKTHPIEYYNPLFINKMDHGTLHVSTLDETGQACSATTTVNLYFGSKIRGRRTGIIFNDGMDDFRFLIKYLFITFYDFFSPLSTDCNLVLLITITNLDFLQAH